MVNRQYQIEVLVEHGRLTGSFSYLSDRQLAPWVRVKIPFRKRIIVGLTVACKKEVESSRPLLEILEVIDKNPILNDEAIKLCQWMADYYLCSLIKVVQTILPSAFRPKSSSVKPQNEAYVDFLAWDKLKGVKQQAALDFLKDEKQVLRQDFNNLYPNVLKALVDKNLAKVSYQEKQYHFQSRGLETDLLLSPKQKSVFEQLNSQENHQVNLLFGVTGSGKSEIYLQLCKQCLNKGKQVLVLVPEIGLTPQMIRLFKSRLGDNIAIYHSKLNNQERYEQYQLVKNGQVKVVVGTRSAVFLPFENLGYLIIDEEHDGSYKQDNMPKYHTRDVAIWRGQYHNCPVLLASATPALESYARALKGVYNLLVLDERINGKLPEVELVDMNKELKENQRSILSGKLLDHITNTLANKQQVMILLNRRGYTPIIKCQNCQAVIQCDNCDIAMVYHKEEKVLKCHTCGAIKAFPKICAKCGSKDFLNLGFGTERLVEELQNCFPTAKILRMDRDTTNAKQAAKEILGAFKAQEADILVGTQMIAKGLDFSEVALMGILNGDVLLNRLDYRAQETTFALLMQAAGRAGRQIPTSHVIIQAYQVQHYALRLVKKHDYQGFFNQEMRYRKLGAYPPYQYMILLSLSGEEFSEIINVLTEIKTQLQAMEIYVLGPSQLLRKNNKETGRLTLKGKDLNLMQKGVAEVLTAYQKYPLVVDVNPLHSE